MTAMPRPSTPHRSGISFRILALEPRMMFDGAAAGDVADKTAADSKSTDTAAPAAATTTDTSAKSAAAAAEADKSAATATVVRWNGQVSTDTTGTRHEVVVVDTTVADWQTLVAGINPNTPIILLRPNANGMGELEALAQIMKQFHDLDAIHLVAEGRTGAILLGNEVLYSGDMTAASPYLATIGAALRDGGDFMLYSCSVAGSENGRAFIDSFARALGNVDVAASTDLTGPTRLGGDWDLEYHTGDIETILPFTLAGMQDISHCLGCSTGGAKNQAGFDSKVYMDGVEFGSYTFGSGFKFTVDIHYTYSAFNMTHYLIPAGKFLSNYGIGTGNSTELITRIDECAVASNTAPTVTAGSSSASYTENGTAVTVDNTITVADAEQSDITGATAVISSNFVTGDTLNFTTQNGITGSWNAGTHTLTLSGTATKAQYQAALRSITFSSSSEVPTSAARVITWKVNDGQSSNNLSAAVTSSVSVVPVNDLPSGTPSVSGTTQVGQTLTGSAASVTDLDGLGTFSYQWQSSADGSTWGNISGATSSTYSLQQAENGKYVRLKVSYTDGGGTAETVYSTATAAVTAPPTTTVSAASLSADTGSSSTDWVTKTASQTVSGSLSAALVAGEKVQVSFDNGGTWQDLSATTGDTSFSFSADLSGTNTFKARVTNPTGSSTAFSHAYTLDTTAPTAPSAAISADTGGNTSDGVTKTAAQTVTVTAEGGATLDIDYGDGSPHGTANGSHTYTADGKYTISVTATDAAGNVSSAGTKEIVIDRSAPTDITPSSSQLATTSATNGATFCSLSATDATNISGFTDAWTYTLGGTDAGKFSIVGGNLVINNTGGLTVGTYSVDVTATDTAGNTFTKTLSLSVVSGPNTTVSAVSLSADTGSSNSDWITKTASQTVSGSLSAALVAGERVEVSFDNGGTWQTVTTSVGDTSFSFITSLSGTGTFKARVTDNIGSSTAFSHTYALDSVGDVPSTPDLTTASDSGASSTDNITNNTTPTFTGTAEKGATVTLYDADGTTVLGTATADVGTGIWTITSSALSAGEHQVKAKAVDVAGNASALSTELKVIIDTTAPADPSAPDLIASSDSGTSDTDNKTTNTTPTFTGTAEKGATVTLYDTDGTTVLGTTTANADTGIWTITSSALGVGTHTVKAKATDAAGNTSVASGSLSVEIVTGPAAPTGLAISSDTGRSNTDNITQTTTQTISGSGPAGAVILIYKNGAPVGSVTADAGTGAWTYNTGALADGTYVFTARARVSEQDSVDSAALNVTVDTAAPTAPRVTGISSDNGSSASDGVTSDRTLVISGTTEAGSTVEVFKDGVSIGAATVTGTAWSFDYTGTSLADGSYVFTAKATDAAGNLSALSSGFTAKVTPNVNAPAASVVVLAPPKGIEGGTYTYTLPAGSFTDADVGDTLTYSASGLPAGLTINRTTGAINGTPGTGGSYTVVVTATDSAGLTATKTMTITVDNALLPSASDTKADQTVNVAEPGTGTGAGNDAGGSAPLVTTVREPTVSDKPAGMETVVRTVPLGPSDSAGAGFNLNSGGIVNGGGTGSGLGGGLGGGITSALGDTRSSGTGGTFQVALAGRAPGGGDALVVNTRVPDASFDAGSRISVTVPGDAFAHTRADATVTLTATRGDGAALPGWMNFNPRTGTFEGTPPPNFRGEVVVKVTARDNDGRQVVQTFKIVVGQGQGNAVPDGGGEGRSQGAPGRSGDLGTDGKLAAKAAGRPGLAEQLRQMSFKGGMARHIALFDTITRGDKVA